MKDKSKFNDILKKKNLLVINQNKLIHSFKTHSGICTFEIFIIAYKLL